MGSVGCIFKATPADQSNPSRGYIPPSCVVVRDAERHLQNRGNETYVTATSLYQFRDQTLSFMKTEERRAYAVAM